MWISFEVRPALAVKVLCALMLGGAGLGAAQQTAPTVPGNLEEMRLQRRPTPASVVSFQTPTVAAPEDFSKAPLAPGALLSMNTYGVPEMSGIGLRVDAAGNVSVPTLGTVHVAGQTTMEAQKTIADALKKAELLVNPTVQLNVVEFAASFVSVLGEVQTPGRFSVIGARSLSDVLALAGGETLSAGNDIEVQHAAVAGQQRVEHITYTPNDTLNSLKQTTVMPGDSVYVRRAGTVYVLGAVSHPGGYVMVNGGMLNIYQALSLAGGTTLDAAKNGMYIVRPHDEVFETIKVPFNKLAKGSQAQMALRQNDVLYVPRSGVRVSLLDGSAIIGAAVNGALYMVR